MVWVAVNVDGNIIFYLFSESNVFWGGMACRYVVLSMVVGLIFNFYDLEVWGYIHGCGYFCDIAQEDVIFMY